MQRVVVTGIGVVSSIGIGKDEFWKNLLLGVSGITPVSSFDTSFFPSSVGGEVKSFYPRSSGTNRNLEQYGRASQLAISASELALQDSNILSDRKGLISSNIDVIVGTTMGEAQILESIDELWILKGENSISVDWIFQYPSSNLAHNVSLELGLLGNSICIPTACSAGNYALGYGFNRIQLGQSQICLVGGADAFSRIAYTGFNRMFAMAPKECAPFDKNRKGIILGEGAGFLVIESFENAQKRNARIYAEILGYGLSCDAMHMTIPSSEGLVSVMKKAIKNSKISDRQVDYISPHGTGTHMNDKTECKAIHTVFGDRGTQIPVSSIKSMLGHTMGAASAIEAIVCCLAIYESKIPPTINFQTFDDECNVDCVPNVFRQKEINVAISNSFAFGGNNAAVVFSKQNLSNES